jgi:hypothetical protein
MKRRSFIKKAGVTSLTGALIPALVTASRNNDFSLPQSEVLPLFNGANQHDENIVFPAEARGVIDITKAPYNCDRTGVKDCTEALIRAMDDLLRPTLEAQKALVKEMEDDPRQDFTHAISVESLKVKGVVAVIFPAHPSFSKILYFPKGTYKVSDTICYTFEDLNNTSGNELNRQIIVRGQSEKETIIRLKDNCPGFEAGANKPVFSFMRKFRSNVAMANMFENITISTGSGNEGASGLRYFGNNMGAVRNVTIRTEDPQGRGPAGILCDRFNLSGCYFKNITVRGFDYGIQVLPNRMYTVFEHIKLISQKIAGFLVDETPVSIRGLKSENSVPGLKLTGAAGHVTLLDSELVNSRPSDQGSSHQSNNYAAIEHDNGVLFARNVTTQGYISAIGKFGNPVLKEAVIGEYSSHGVFTLFDKSPKQSLNLPVEETPEIPWEQEMDQWISVNEFGAKGDGETDDTSAIQKAIGSGKKDVYFQPGRYVINGQIRVPKTVERINFMFSDLVAGEKLRAMSDQGTFKIDEYSDKPLIIEDLFAFEEYRGEQYFIDHASKRTLILSDLHTQTGAMYINSVSGGKVFIENICCTDQFLPRPNCYRFKGQKVWARQINPERADPEVINEGSQLWVLGFKTEGRGTGFHTSRGGSTEVLGGVVNIGGEGKPFIVNDESNVSIVCATNGWYNNHVFKEFAMEKRNGETKILAKDDLPKRILFRGIPGSAQKDYYIEQYFVPLYTGSGKGGQH